MPVFRVMAPQLAEQYSGGGGGYTPGSFTMPRQFDPVMPYSQQAGVQPGVGPMGPVQPGMAGMPPGGAQNPAMGGGPYQQGTGMPGPGGSTATDAFNPLADPTAAVYRALLSRGINPDIPTSGVSSLLKKADDIVRQLAVRLGTGGQADVLTGPGFQDAVSALIGRATSGGGGTVLSGPTEGRALGSALAQLISPQQTGGLSEGAQFLADIIGDSPKAAVAFLDSLLYGNRAPAVRSALSRPLAGQGIRYQQAFEQPENTPMFTGRSALDILLSGVLGNGAQLPPNVPGPGGALGAGGGLPPGAPRAPLGGY